MDEKSSTATPPPFICHYVPSSIGEGSIWLRIRQKIGYLGHYAEVSTRASDLENKEKENG